MLSDYYGTLGVPSSASIDVIKKAYRDRALRYHPDRGGTHERMVAINEAWEILSNPALRSKYDLARQANASTAAKTEAATAAEKARRSAEDYPRRWADFQKWMDTILGDFTGAEYGKRNGFLATSIGWPTARKSVSGRVFIICGGILGFIVGFVFDAIIQELFGIKGGGGLSYLVFVFAALGAWAGRAIHEQIGASLKRAKRPN